MRGKILGQVAAVLTKLINKDTKLDFNCLKIIKKVC